MFGNDSSVQIALNLLLNVITQRNFQDAYCIMVFPYNESEYQFPTLFNNSNPIVMNPTACYPGCSHYILHDYSDNIYLNSWWLKGCFLHKGNYRFKAIILMETVNITNFLDQIFLNSIFISKQDDFFHVDGFTNLNSTNSYLSERRLNSWCITTNKFADDGDDVGNFFERWKRNEGMNIVYIPSQINTIPFDYTINSSHYGTEKNLIAVFAKSLNLDFEVKGFQLLYAPLLNGKVIVSDPNIYSYPSSYPLTEVYYSFFVPKPK